MLAGRILIATSRPSLAQGEDFEGGIGAAPEEHACGCKHCDEE